MAQVFGQNPAPLVLVPDQDPIGTDGSTTLRIKDRLVYVIQYSRADGEQCPRGGPIPVSSGRPDTAPATPVTVPCTWSASSMPARARRSARHPGATDPGLTPDGGVLRAPLHTTGRRFGREPRCRTGHTAIMSGGRAANARAHEAPQRTATRPWPDSNRHEPLCRRNPNHSGLRPYVPSTGLEPATPRRRRTVLYPLSYEGMPCRRKESNPQGYCFTGSASRHMSACVG